MKPKKLLSPLRGCFLFLCFCLLLPAATLAQSTWQWQASLSVDQIGESMYMPSAVAFDEESGRYYVVDTGKNRLVSFDRDGEILRAFTAEGRLKSPFDMVRLDNGNLWVVEKGRNSLTYIDIAGRKVETHTLRDQGSLVFPDRIAVAGGKLFVLDRASGMVLRLADDLSVEQRYGCPDCTGGMVDFVLDGDSILAIEPQSKKIFRFRTDGTIAEEIDLGEEAGFPISLDVGASGFYYVLDRHRSSVIVYSDTGHFQYRFLGPGQAPGKVYFPRQIRFDPWGRLCVVDEGNGRVEVFNQ